MRHTTRYSLEKQLDCALECAKYPLFAEGAMLANLEFYA